MITRYEHPTAQEAYTAAAQMLNRQLQRTSGPVLLLCTGGSAITLVNEIDQATLPNDITISVLDERYSEDPTVNNCALLLETDFGKRVLKQKIPFIDTRVQNGEAMEELGDRFEKSLKDWKTTHPNGTILATMGLGDDGHISGVLPFPENAEHFYHLFLHDTRWVAAYDGEGKNPHRYRVTTTLAFLRDFVDTAIVLVTGSKKRIALKQALASGIDLHVIPSRILNHFRNALIYTDIRI